MAVRVFCQVLYQRVPLLRRLSLRGCTGVSFIDDHTFRTCTDKFIPAAVTFDVIQGNDHEGIGFKNRSASADVSFQFRNS